MWWWVEPGWWQTQTAIASAGGLTITDAMNVTAMAQAKVAFIAPLAASRVPKGLFAALEVATATSVEYVAGRDQAKPADQRCVYRVLEDTHELAGPRNPTRSTGYAGSRPLAITVEPCQFPDDLLRHKSSGPS